MRSSANFRSESQSANPLYAEAKHILTQNDHSGSFKVICFRDSEDPLRGYVVHYNKCGLECEDS